MKIDADAVRKIVEVEIRRARLFAWLFGRNRHTVNILKVVQSDIEKMITEEEQKAQNAQNARAAGFDINLYDEEEFLPNCTVQVLHNTYTDEYSVGYWDNDKLKERMREL